MRKSQFEVLLVEAARACGENELVVVGSRTVHAYTDKAPVEVLVSKECDLWAKSKFEKLSVLSDTLGQRSACFAQHGVYVDPEIVLLPKGWEGRLKPMHVGPVTAWCLDVNDLVVSKLNAGRLKDYEFINAVLRANLADWDVIIKRIQTFPDPHQQAVLLARLRISGERMP
jgi:Nucleotidyltransferase of unknown function (DUF6036)